MVHAVDLDHGLAFANLPPDFLEALVADIVAFRGKISLPAGPIDEVTAWLAGRDHGLDDSPEIGPWL